MNQAVISEGFLELIAGREVCAALFTTYAFEPDFFELEVIPLLLNRNTAYSVDDRVKRFMVREELREAEIPIDVFYDASIFREIGDHSPQMEYLCNGVDLGNRAFHAKLIMILLQKGETQTMLLGAGSNNISRAGWWDNIECQHWEEIRSGAIRRQLINIVKEDIEFLKRYRSISTGSSGAALDRIEEFLSKCKASNRAKPIHYFGLSHAENRRGKFMQFIRSKLSRMTRKGDWNLEIVSPFFANDPRNETHREFLKLGLNEIKLFLPIDSDNSRLCTYNYFENIQNEENVHWAKWEKGVEKKLELSKGYYRRLHAKMYHFFNANQSWVFVGSVNFTQKAFHNNVEAGFLVKLGQTVKFLERISNDVSVDDFTKPDEDVPGSDLDEESTAALPKVRLCYDWKLKKLEGQNLQRERCQIQIISAEGEPAIEPWIIDGEAKKYEKDVKGLENILKNGSLVKVEGKYLDRIENQEFPSHWVLLQQVEWGHKPLDVPNLTPAQILAIYAEFSPIRRQVMLMNTQIRELVLRDEGGELTVQEDHQNIYQFFCEYAEIFRAFRNLKLLLKRESERQGHGQIDYYLTGEGVDSLPSLIKRTVQVDEKSELSDVTRYLILLCALEIYSVDPLFETRPNVTEAKKSIQQEIERLKDVGRIKLKKNSFEYQKNFFKWFEMEFLASYSVVEEES